MSLEIVRRSASSSPAPGVRVEPHPYDGPVGQYLIVDALDAPGLRLIYETDGDRVTSFRAGRRDAVDLIEGCA